MHIDLRHVQCCSDIRIVLEALDMARAGLKKINGNGTENWIDTLDIREISSHIRANAGSACAIFGLAESAILCDSRWLLLKQPPRGNCLPPLQDPHLPNALRSLPLCDQMALARAMVATIATLRAIAYT